MNPLSPSASPGDGSPQPAPGSLLSDGGSYQLPIAISQGPAALGGSGKLANDSIASPDSAGTSGDALARVAGGDYTQPGSPVATIKEAATAGRASPGSAQGAPPAEPLPLPSVGTVIGNVVSGVVNAVKPLVQNVGRLVSPPPSTPPNAQSPPAAQNPPNTQRPGPASNGPSRNSPPASQAPPAGPPSATTPPASRTSGGPAAGGGDPAHGTTAFSPGASRSTAGDASGASRAAQGVENGGFAGDLLGSPRGGTAAAASIAEQGRASQAPQQPGNIVEDAAGATLEAAAPLAAAVSSTVEHALSANRTSPAPATNSPGPATNSPVPATNSPGPATNWPGTATNSPGTAQTDPGSAHASPGTAPATPAGGAQSAEAQIPASIGNGSPRFAPPGEVTPEGAPAVEADAVSAPATAAAEATMNPRLPPAPPSVGEPVSAEAEAPPMLQGSQPGAAPEGAVVERTLAFVSDLTQSVAGSPAVAPRSASPSTPAANGSPAPPEPAEPAEQTPAVPVRAALLPVETLEEGDRPSASGASTELTGPENPGGQGPAARGSGPAEYDESGPHASPPSETEGEGVLADAGASIRLASGNGAAASLDVEIGSEAESHVPDAHLPASAAQAASQNTEESLPARLPAQTPASAEIDVDIEVRDTPAAGESPASGERRLPVAAPGAQLRADGAAEAEFVPEPEPRDDGGDGTAIMASAGAEAEAEAQVPEEAPPSEFVASLAAELDAAVASLTAGVDAAVQSDSGASVPGENGEAALLEVDVEAAVVAELATGEGGANEPAPSNVEPAAGASPAFDPEATVVAASAGETPPAFATKPATAEEPAIDAESGAALALPSESDVQAAHALLAATAPSSSEPLSTESMTPAAPVRAAAAEAEAGANEGAAAGRAALELAAARDVAATGVSAAARTETAPAFAAGAERSAPAPARETAALSPELEAALEAETVAPAAGARTEAPESVRRAQGDAVPNGIGPGLATVPLAFDPVAAAGRSRTADAGLGRITADPELVVRFAEALRAERPWTWRELAGRFVMPRERAAVRDAAFESGLLPAIPVDPGTGAADFPAALLARHTDRVERGVLALGSDAAEYVFLESRVASERLGGGLVWHRASDDGTMELVPSNFHHVVRHASARTAPPAA